MILTHAQAYGLPAIVIGLLFGTGGLLHIQLDYKQRSAQLPIRLGPTGDAVAWAFLMGIVMPTVSSVGPIRLALSRTLREGLDTSRPKTSAVKLQIERASNTAISWPTFIVGFLLTASGFGIYYLMPLSMLTLNLSIFMQIFMWVFMGMLGGEVLLFLNVEVTIENALVYVFLAPWEQPSVRLMVQKNLIGHRQRNRKTSIMFALAIAITVYMSVIFQMLLSSEITNDRLRAGANLRMAFNRIDILEVQKVEDVLARPEFAAIVANRAWATNNLDMLVARGQP